MLSLTNDPFGLWTRPQYAVACRVTLSFCLPDSLPAKAGTHTFIVQLYELLLLASWSPIISASGTMLTIGHHDSPVNHAAFSNHGQPVHNRC